MSEDNIGSTEMDAATLSEPVSRPLKSENDWFLQTLVGHANYDGLSIQITLNLGGSMVSGVLISSEEYFEQSAVAFKGMFSNPEVGQSYFDMVSSCKPSPKVDDGKPILPAHYIHLRNARTYAPGRPQFTVSSALWRGRISEVTSFFTGEPPKSE